MQIDVTMNIVVIASLVLHVLQQKEASLQSTYFRHLIIKDAYGISLNIIMYPTHTSQSPVNLE